MSVDERLIQETKERTKVEVLKKVVQRAIIKGYSTNGIADITELTKEQVEYIRKEMLT